MDFVIRYEVETETDLLTDRMTFHSAGLHTSDKSLRDEIFAEVYNMNPSLELTGVLFSYGGTVYEIRQSLEGPSIEYLFATHGGGAYFFELLAGDGMGWLEDLLILGRCNGRAVAAEWFPVTNP